MEDKDSSNSSLPTQVQGRQLPPRAKSAYYSRRLATLPSDPSHVDPSTVRPTMRRRASFASGLPETGTGSVSIGVKSVPTLRRGATSIPRRSSISSGVGIGSKTFSTRPPLPENDGDSGIESNNVNTGVPPSPEAICGMCGNCTEIGMPPWAPERLAKVNAVERGRILRELRSREEAGRVTAEIRESGVAAAAAAAMAGRPKPRRPPKRQSTRLTAVLAPGNNSDARRARAIAHAARQAEKPVKIMSMDDMPVADSSNESNIDIGLSSSLKIHSGESELDALGVDDGTLECAECDALEKQVLDLEIQLKVLRNVVDNSNNSHSFNSKSNSKSVSSSSTIAKKNDDTKKTAWHERVIGTFVGAPPGSETAKLKDEVAALRKATDILFKKLQHSNK